MLQIVFRMPRERVPNETLKNRKTAFSLFGACVKNTMFWTCARNKDYGVWGGSVGAVLGPLGSSRSVFSHT